MYNIFYILNNILLRYFNLGMKTYHTISLIGLAICCIGEILRKAAILTAKSNFNHLVSRSIFLFQF